MTTTRFPKKEKKRGLFAALVAFATPRRRAARRNTMRVRSSEEHRLDREMVEAFVRIHGADGTVPSKGIYKIRAGEQHPWRVLWRRLKEASAEGASVESLLEVVDVLERHIKEQLYAPRRTAGAETKPSARLLAEAPDGRLTYTGEP